MRVRPSGATLEPREHEYTVFLTPQAPPKPLSRLQRPPKPSTRHPNRTLKTPQRHTRKPQRHTKTTAGTSQAPQEASFDHTQVLIRDLERQLAELNQQYEEQLRVNKLVGQKYHNSKELIDLVGRSLGLKVPEWQGGESIC